MYLLKINSNFTKSKIIREKLTEEFNMMLWKNIRFHRRAKDREEKVKNATLQN
jgi:hypothetical protein